VSFGGVVWRKMKLGGQKKDSEEVVEYGLFH